MSDNFSQTPPPQPPYQPPPPPGGPPPGWVYPPPPPQRRRRNWLLPASIAIGCLPWVILFFVAMGAIVGGAGKISRGEHIALIRVSGVITAGQGGGGVFGESGAGSDDLVAQIERARSSGDAKAVVIRIDSPGGSAAGSAEIYDAIRRLRDSGKPVYTSMADVAASGGYYVAAACDRIYADASTITGSIGVRFGMVDMSQLYKKIGFSPTTIKAGKFKDIGSSDRPLTAEERTLLQQIVDDIHGTFMDAVAKGRHMSASEVEKLADGRIYTGNQAIKLGLVDKIGGLHETVAAAARRVGIKGKPRVVEYRRRSLFESILGDSYDEAAGSLERAAAKKVLEKLLETDANFREMQ